MPKRRKITAFVLSRYVFMRRALNIKMFIKNRKLALKYMGHFFYLDCFVIFLIIYIKGHEYYFVKKLK